MRYKGKEQMENMLSVSCKESYDEENDADKNWPQK